MDAIRGFRKHFPVLQAHTYLNTAAWGLLHDGLLEWRRQHDQAFLHGGSDMKIPALKILEDTRERLGTFFNCPARQIALVPNFSLGLNLLLEGMPAGSRILLLQDDYPSVNWPFENREFEVYYAPISVDMEAGIKKAIEKHRINVLAVSLVQWIGGEMVEPAFLTQLKKEYPGLKIIADGTQFLGAFDMDFEGSGIDVLGASGYKWLLGGNGNGLMLFSKGAGEFFKIPSAGFNSVGADLSRKDAIPFARKLEPGHLDTLNFGSLNYALGFLGELGMSAINAYNRQLSKTIISELDTLGLATPRQLSATSHSTIFNIPDKGRLYSHLRKNGLVCSRRGPGIRLSFHCYNTENDLDKLIELLKSHNHNSQLDN